MFFLKIAAVNNEKLLCIQNYLLIGDFKHVYILKNALTLFKVNDKH